MSIDQLIYYKDNLLFSNVNKLILFGDIKYNQSRVLMKGLKLKILKSGLKSDLYLYLSLKNILFFRIHILKISKNASYICGILLYKSDKNALPILSVLRQK